MPGWQGFEEYEALERYTHQRRTAGWPSAVHITGCQVMEFTDFGVLRQSLRVKGVF
jgi:hypothetical protein